MIHRLKRRAGALIRQALVKLLPGMGEQIMQLATYYPHAHTAYSVPAYPDQVLQVDDEPLPIPPISILGGLLHIRYNLGAEREGRHRDDAPHLA